MPTVFSPPSVSALNTKVARYFSGSRAVIAEIDPGEGLIFAFAEIVFEFVTRFVFGSAFWQALLANARKQIARRVIDSGV